MVTTKTSDWEEMGLGMGVLLVLVRLQHPALGLLVVEGVSKGLGLGSQSSQGAHLLVDHVFQLLTIGWNEEKNYV